MLQLDYDREDPMTEIVAMKIVEIAKIGEHDPVQVSERVLAELKASPHDVTAAQPQPSKSRPSNTRLRSSGVSLSKSRPMGGRDSCAR